MKKTKDQIKPVCIICKLPIQIIIMGLGLLTIGTLCFIITAHYFSLERMNSCFSLLSSLATIFATGVAVLITQDFRKQKRAELLSQFSKEKLEIINYIGGELSLISSLITMNAINLDRINVTERNFRFLSKRLQAITNDKKLILETNELLNEYNRLLSGLNGLIDGYEYMYF